MIMDCRTTSVHKFRAILGFKQYDGNLTKEQSVLTKIISSFDEENIQIQYKALCYRTDLYFHDYKRATQIDEKGNSDRNIDYEMKREKAIEQELGCTFIRVDPVKEGFDNI